MGKNVKVIGGNPSINKTQLGEHSQRVAIGGNFPVRSDLVFVAAGSSGNTLVSTTHAMRRNDRIRFIDGDLIGREFEVLSIIDADTFTVNYKFDGDLPSNGDKFDHIRPISMSMDSDGNIGVSGITTATHAADSPFVALDEGNLNLGVRQDTPAVDTSADGDYQPMKTTNKGELWTKDLDLNVLITAMTAKFGAIGQQASAASAAVVLSTEQEAILAALSAKFGTIGQKANAGSAAVTLSTEQEALLTSIDGKDFATQASLAALLAKFGSLGQKASSGSAPVVLSTEQQAQLAAIVTAIEALNATTTIIDFLDTPVLLPSSTTIPKSSSNAIEVVNSLAADCKSLEVTDTIGEYMALYTDAARTDPITFLPIAGGKKAVNIPSGTTVYLGAVDDVDITTANTKLIIEFMG